MEHSQSLWPWALLAGVLTLALIVLARARSGEPADDPHAPRRALMVDEQLRKRGITDEAVLRAMGRVPRHRFVPADQEPFAYEDRPLPIGDGQTISQPFIVALMTQLAAPAPKLRALDIGTGSGYQAAVLAEIVGRVDGIEIVPALAESAKARLAALGYRNVTVRQGDGYRGLPERAPFDIIVVAAAAPVVPRPLLDQLAPGGRLVIPVGDDESQRLLVITKRPDGTFDRREVTPVRFVPLTGEARAKKEDE